MDKFMQNDAARDDVLILVDAQDRQIGVASKAQAHAEGLLHRAFSVVLVREVPGEIAAREVGEGGEGGVPSPAFEILLTRRAQGKYHSGGLWTNSCCSHPRAGEDVLSAAERRLCEELGCKAVALHELGAFTYRADFAPNMAEHEVDHVFLGHVSADATFSPDPAEVSEMRWVTPAALTAELSAHPETFTAWAPRVFEMTFLALSV